jgi:hypothetical protein
MAALKAEVSVDTEVPELYLLQLCRHFAPHAPSMPSGKRGHAEFGFGRCTIQAAQRYLTLVVEAEDEHSLARMQHLVGLRLERCMWRERPIIRWVRSS